MPRPVSDQLFGMDDVFTFGKHKNLSVRQVLKVDPQWIKWAFETLNAVNFEEDVLQALEDTTEQDRQRSGRSSYSVGGSSRREFNDED